MKTKRIAKILGLGLAAALAFSLGAGIGISPASADVHEWSTITTPSWEDYVIFPDSEILDYAVGGEDGNTVYSVVTDNTLELGSGTYAGPGGIAEWSTEQEVDGSYSAKLQAPAPGVGSDGDKAWVCIIPCEDVTVDSLSSFSYDVYSTLGQPAYAKFYIDVNGDGSPDGGFTCRVIEGEGYCWPDDGPAVSPARSKAQKCATNPDGEGCDTAMQNYCYAHPESEECVAYCEAKPGAGLLVVRRQG